MTISNIALATAVVGAIMFFIPDQAKLNRFGEILLLSGLLAFLLHK